VVVEEEDMSLELPLFVIKMVLLVDLVVVLEPFMEVIIMMESEIEIPAIVQYQTRDILEEKEIIPDLRMKTMAEAAAVVPVVLEEMVRAHRLEELVVMERQA
jgi:predicted secreted protein